MSSNTAVRNARRHTLRIAAAALTAVAGLTLTACSGADTPGAAKAAGGTERAVGAAGVDAASSSADAAGTDTAGRDAAGPSADGPDSGAKAGTGAEGGTKAGAAGQQAGTAHATGGRAGSGIERCHTSGLKASFNTGGDAVPDEDAGGSTTTSINLVNKGSRACKIGGFPGVDLTSVNGGERWSLARSSAKFSSITLAPGDSTDVTLNVAMTKENEGFYQPAWVEITPPNETTSLKVEWPWGTLVDQRGATHPATFVNPIG
ncbi:flagellar motor protein MotB [Streptomyces noursei ZPM]|uniref:DUF4232 domain-containing protein n=1 Tax=Streptomyces noursei TaxID=1971 RepID=A0A401R2F9_STRNR|nr:DUF4232 domain-containing protein [Streptomyces noursei]AKA04445.1 flagellar motor protein MotB [Streptomyces noursei ZPM]EOT05338.1 hypothetical protein K530_03979 [Streptomyces noursei CCRC 11814]EXU85296.1 flagellar motor protein MotB [Streptomyces noursei PD-1]UWS72826.1 DUF4232 domain-containing protein [Streptomyces noursei]GCB91800.1 hypothetical protein SALB_04542 [Streptomyces noursei]